MKKIIYALILSLMPLIGYTQQSVEVSLSMGATGVDLDKLVEKDETDGTTVNDWDVANFGVNVQYLFKTNGNVGYGAELMYQYLYWYSVRVPYGSQPIHREYDVSGMKIASFARFNPGSTVAFDIGPQLGFFNGVNPGVYTSINFNIPVSEKVRIPIKVKAEVIHNIVVTVPVSLNAGIQIAL